VCVQGARQCARGSPAVGRLDTSVLERSGAPMSLTTTSCPRAAHWWPSCARPTLERKMLSPSGESGPEWREPDSNGGTTDFQSCGPGAQVRTICRRFRPSRRSRSLPDFLGTCGRFSDVTADERRRRPFRGGSAHVGAPTSADRWWLSGAGTPPAVAVRVLPAPACGEGGRPRGGRASRRVSPTERRTRAPAFSAATNRNAVTAPRFPGEDARAFAVCAAVSTHRSATSVPPPSPPKNVRIAGQSASATTLWESGRSWRRIRAGPGLSSRR
jgi:hypothetical protein